MILQDIVKIKQEFGDRTFSGKDVAKLLGIDPRGTGGIFKYMRERGMIRQIKSGVYQFVASPQVPTPAPIAPAETPSAPPEAASAPVCVAKSVVKIGTLYIPETVNWLADTLDTGRVTLHTAILEIDPNTKHARNKRVTFRKDTEPREYAQLVAWLDDLAGEPPNVVDETALELAAELEMKLNAANKEIADLKAKIDAIRGIFRGEL